MAKTIILLLVVLLQGCTLSNDLKTHMVCKGLAEYSDRTELGLPKIPTTKNYTLIERKIQNFLVKGKGPYLEETEWFLIENDKLISEPRERKFEGESESRNLRVTEHEIHMVEFLSRTERDVGKIHLPSFNAVNDIHFERISGDWFSKKHSWGSDSKTSKKTNERVDIYGKCERTEKKF